MRTNYFKSKFYRYLANIFTPIPGIVNLKAWNRKIFFLNRAEYKIKKDCFIGENLFCIRGNEKYLSIDENTTIGVFAKFFIFNEVKIGRFCLFAQDISFINGGHDVNNYQPFSAILEIGNGVWIGSGAKIIARTNMKIGNNVVIGGGVL